ncbi:MAG: tyrosine-type recombinase/integrase [Anaerolineae bacterium]|nr:tyrosine-type recombinase/integrase [Anaerolineae bacterium]
MTILSHPTLTEWLAYLNQMGKSTSTKRNYDRAVQHFIHWSEQSYGELFDPAAIIPRDVVDWQAFQQRIEKAKPATINLRLVGLSRYFKWAVARGYVRQDPTVDVASLRLDQRHPKALTDRQVRRLLRQVAKSENLRDMALVELLLGTGLRVSEVLALQAEDVVLNSRSGEVIVRRGKGGIQRRIPLITSVRSALRQYLDSQPRLKPRDLLWVGERGPLQNRGSILYLLKKYMFQAGLDEDLISPHVLRHTFASRYLRTHPGDLRGLAAILGHSNLNTVLIYTEPTVEELADKMEQAEVS